MKRLPDMRRTGKRLSARILYVAMAAHAALLAQGCGAPLLTNFDGLAMNQVVADRGCGIPSDFPQRFKSALEEALPGACGLVPVRWPEQEADSVLFVDAHARRGGSEGDAEVEYVFRTSSGRPVLRAVLANPPEPTRLGMPGTAAEVLAGFLAEARRPAWPDADVGAMVCPAGDGPVSWETLDAPGRLSAEASIGVLGIGPGKAGFGRGAPGYRDALGRAFSADAALRLGFNGYLGLELGFGYSSFEGLACRSGDVEIRFGDMDSKSLSAGLSAGFPISCGTKSSLLWRFYPPFPDTRGLWLTADACGGITWFSDFDAVVLRDHSGGGSAFPPGVEIAYFASGPAFFMEFRAGIEIRTLDVSGLIISFGIEAGIRLSDAPPEAAGKAAEGEMMVLFPIRATLRLAF